VNHDEVREAERYKAYILKAAKTFNHPVPVLLGIGSRESQWGLALRPPKPSGTGDFIRRDGELPPDGGGWGRGLMQIDYAAHEFARTGPWRDPKKNIYYGAEVLRNAMNVLRSIVGEENAPDFELLAMSLAGYHAAVSAYNTGPGNVIRSIRKGRDVDFTTHGGDYSEDVIRRATWYARNVEWAAPKGWAAEEMEPRDVVNSNNEFLKRQINSLANTYNIID